LCKLSNSLSSWLLNLNSLMWAFWGQKKCGFMAKVDRCIGYSEYHLQGSLPFVVVRNVADGTFFWSTDDTEDKLHKGKFSASHSLMWYQDLRATVLCVAFRCLWMLSTWANKETFATDEGKKMNVTSRLVMFVHRLYLHRCGYWRECLLICRFVCVSITVWSGVIKLW